MCSGLIKGSSPGPENKIFNSDMGVVEAGTQDSKHVLLVYVYFVQDCMLHSFQEVAYKGPKRLCFPDVLLFSKKICVLAARMVARNFTRALGYAKRPLSPMPDFVLGRHRVGHISQPADSVVHRYRCCPLSMLVGTPVGMGWGCGGG